MIPKPVMDAVYAVSLKLNNSGVKWAVGGDLGQAFRNVEVTPSNVEIITDKAGSEMFQSIVSDFSPSEMKLVERREPRDAKIEGKEIPLHSQSYFFDFKVGKVPVLVHGNLRYKVGEWEWGDALEFDPETINMVGKRIPVVPIVLMRDLYKGLGWYDRMRLIADALSRQQFGEYGGVE